MSVSATTETTSTATNDYAYVSNSFREPVQELDKNAFLQLFVTQLQYQDPTSPQDQSQFMSQMAQFTMLEQLTNVYTEVAGLSILQEMNQASSLIGRQVEVKDSEGALLTGQVEKVSFTDGFVQIYVDGNAYDLTKVTEVY